MLAKRFLSSVAAAALAAAGLLSAAPSAAASPAPPVGVTTRWDERLAKIESRLAAGDWNERGARKLIGKMVEDFAGFEADPATLARAAALLAIAEAGGGRREEATWHWHAAAALDPAAIRLDLSPYGDAGRFLAEIEPRRDGVLSKRYAAQSGAALRSAMPVERSDRTRFDPSRVQRGRVPPPVEIEVVVDVDGRPHEPVLVTPSRFPGFAFAALESVSGWRFEPARTGGGEDSEAVASLAKVRLSYPTHVVPGV